MDNKRFEELVIECTDTLYRVSMSMLRNEQDAQDAVHDAILNAYVNRHRLKHEEYFATWLTRILINECKKQLRQRKRYADVGDKLPDASARDDPYLSVEICDAIDSLPEKIRLTVVLFYVEDYSIKEIKNILHIPEGTVKSRLNTGRKMLRERLDCQ